ncbi:AraC family transcriptional regulator (plasmid) [Streptomyces globosus]|uniref:AraC family transcriptional regulator n=1 Tax=Streptomyces globosus TaxID=68209 RepID=A0A344UB87_9ACTN|nr:AraC family transcriptional regulator [Streptomyces globosus]AXE28158.1 AraC family transcriptional regulator [Streptomyces globosus]
MEPLVFHSSDLDETEAFLSGTYTAVRIAPADGDGPTSTRLMRRTTPGFSVNEFEIGFALRYAAQPLGRVCVATVRSGTVSVDADGTGPAATFGPGDTFLHAVPDRPYRGSLDSVCQTAVLFDPDLLPRVAARGARDRGPVRLTGRRPLSAQAGRQLAGTLAHLAHLAALPRQLRTELMLGSAAQLLAATALATLPSTLGPEGHGPGGSPGPAPVDGRDSGTGTLRRAIAFIEDNADRDISLADISAAARVTPRALQYAFSRHAGTTPLAYLRAVRLAAAHADLAAADPSTGATVSAVAARWGFAHTGRFAAAYRRRYGSSPSATLLS